MSDRNFRLARWIALLLPLALMAGALGSQYIGGLHPCEMCHWQRWPHYAAIVVAALAFIVPQRGMQAMLVAIAALLIATSGAIGVFHAGVEWHLWQGITPCSTDFRPKAGVDLMTQLMHQPIVRCDAAQWRLFGISLAGYNAIFSLGGALVILWLMIRSKKPA